LKNKDLVPSPEMIGQRLDKALSLIPEIQSRSRAEYLIDKGLILLNGKSVKASYKVQAEDQIQISIPDPESSKIEPLHLKLDILFEDEDIIVVNKPAGLVVHPAAGHQQDTLVNALVAHTDQLAMKFGEDRPGIVHRLDKETSGVLVVAKNDFAQEKLSAQFKAREIHRIYYALTMGTPAKLEGVIQSYLARHPQDRKRYASVIGTDRKVIRSQEDNPGVGKWAVTHYKVLKRSLSGLSYLQLKLETGRTHQIRVHLSEVGAPIIKDDLYGAHKKLKSIKGNKNIELLQSAQRFALHAAELGFEHPRSKKNLQFKVPWPDYQEIRRTFFGNDVP